jgi:hypothetical protein
MLWSLLVLVIFCWPYYVKFVISLFLLFSLFGACCQRGRMREGYIFFVDLDVCVHTCHMHHTYSCDTMCSTPQKHGYRGSPITLLYMWILASYANLRIQFSIQIFRGSLYTHSSKISVIFQFFVSSNSVVINHQKWGDYKCNQALIVGFGDNDHMIRGLIRFIGMTSR